MKNLLLGVSLAVLSVTSALAAPATYGDKIIYEGGFYCPCIAVDQAVKAEIAANPVKELNDDDNLFDPAYTEADASVRAYNRAHPSHKPSGWGW